MGNVVKLYGEEDRYDQASYWIVRLDNGLSKKERRALREWLAEDPKNAALLERMALLWDKMDTLSRLSDVFPQKSNQPSVAKRFSMGIAAALMIGIAIGLYDGRVPVELDAPIAHTEPQDSHIYWTALGERSTISLKDGSEMTLNTDSRVRVEFSDTHRLITLLQGELNINVAKDKSRPLSVVAGERIFQAVGTQFNVEITDDKKIELLVTEGRVRVAVLAAAADKMSSVDIKNQVSDADALVSAGEQLVLATADTKKENIVKVNSVTDQDIEVKLSWQKGNLVFRGESLEDAVKEVGRYTAVEFVIVDESLKQIRVAGIFKLGDVDSLLNALHANFDIVAQRANDNKILLSSE